jgi:hypothetical protein
MRPGPVIPARPLRPLQGGSLVDAPGVFEYHCPSCRAWVSRLHDVGGRLRCPWCVDWRPLVREGPHAVTDQRRAR